MHYFLTPEDFKGFWNISQNKYTVKDLQCTIEMIQDEILCDLFGIEGYELFLADYDTELETFSNADYQYIYDVFESTVSDCCKPKKVKSRGIKDMLLGFTYRAYIAEQNERDTISGLVNTEHSNSTPVDNTTKFFNMLRRYNRSVDTYNAIVCYLHGNEDKFELFKLGCSKRYMNII